MNEIKNKKAFSKWFFITLAVIAVLVGGFIIALSLGYIPTGKVVDANLTTLVNSPSESASDTTKDTTPAATNSSPTVEQETFNKTGFSFTFKYPSTWTLGTATNSKDQPSAKVAQETVKITSNSGVEFRFDNPIIATGFEEYDLNHAKDISAGTLTFQRNYGNNADGTTLYVATHNDAQNIDALSVSFFGTGKISDADIAVLDEIISSFKFN